MLSIPFRVTISAVGLGLSLTLLYFHKIRYICRLWYYLQLSTKYHLSMYLAYSNIYKYLSTYNYHKFKTRFTLDIFIKLFYNRIPRNIGLLCLEISIFIRLINSKISIYMSSFILEYLYLYAFPKSWIGLMLKRVKVSRTNHKNDSFLIL